VIWNDTALLAAGERGLLVPFEPELTNPGSIDLRLGASYRRPHSYWAQFTPAYWANWTQDREHEIDWDMPLWGEEQFIPEDGYVILPPFQIGLFCTLEQINMPVNCTGILLSKSSAGRRYIEHLHAGLFDAGFRGDGTLELINLSPAPAKLHFRERLVQMAIMEMIAPAQRDYSVTGRYHGQVGATPARQGATNE